MRTAQHICKDLRCVCVCTRADERIIFIYTGLIGGIQLNVVAIKKTERHGPQILAHTDKCPLCHLLT